MKSQLNRKSIGSRVSGMGVSVMFAAVLSACANYSGIPTDQHMAKPQSYETTQSIPSESGHWPAAGWADQFGDAQLKALLAEALKNGPWIDQARARVASANAYSETAKANTMPKVGADYSMTRQQYSGTASVPPPYAGSWQTENKLLASASYDLDLWGKNREALKAAVSQTQASEADAEVVKLTLTTSIARAYNQLARLYDQRDISVKEVAQPDQIERIAAGRIATGLETEVERKTAQVNVATSHASLTALDGQILTTRYQIAALLGAGPDRGLTLQRPSLGLSTQMLLPHKLPPDLVSRRPDLVPPRCRVDPLTPALKEAHP